MHGTNVKIAKNPDEIQKEVKNECLIGFDFQIHPEISKLLDALPVPDPLSIEPGGRQLNLAC